ncbi:dephospho-CoA kinase [Thiomonas intermedia]|uniref:dephospho-CoA kinase n=1 Tax=Thiomonas intermedia TaxID=926 RepID=UPI0009A490A2|nr:dephospho-CoA kinase [Thiomonas intermedia]
MKGAARLRVGLTGGIGSGKSAAADLFAAHGAVIVDADVIAHELTSSGGAAMPALVEAFGPDIRDNTGALDRAAMRQRAFADPEARALLESILHPRIGSVMRQAAAERPGDYLVLVVPLLVEHLDRWRPQIDRLCVVDCPPEVQLARVQARSGLAAEMIEAIMSTQATRAQRLAVADDVLDNRGDREHLSRQVDALHARYRSFVHKN